MKKALILQNKYIGDVLVASVLAKNLKNHFPNIVVHFFCYDKAVCILENNPYIDKVISFNDYDLKRIAVLWKYTKIIKSENYDIIIDPYAKLQSRFITFFTKAEKKISFDKPFFKHIYSDVFKEKTEPEYINCTSIENRCLLLTPLIKNNKKLDYQTEIFLKDEEINHAKELMLKSGISFTKPILIIGVLGSSSDKSWPLSYMAELINTIIKKYDVDLLFNYVPSQQNDVNILLDKIDFKDKIFTNILGQNVREFAAILKNADALIANEGGAVNIAKAIGKPTFSIFSPHKFRNDWGCYENLLIHDSFHLSDIFPEIYQKYELKTILKKPKTFYHLLYPEKVIPRIDNFINNILKITPKDSCSLYKNSKLTPQITALCITYNEENNIERFIKDVSFADEIIMIDSFSTDNTKKIAAKYPFIKFIERKFDNFTNQKNFAIKQATKEWIIFFDLDEHIPEKLKAEIITTINSPNTKDSYWVYRNFFFLGKHIKHSGWKNDKAIRLFKKGKAYYKKSKFVHEEIECVTKSGFLHEKIDHYSFNSKESYKTKLNNYAKLKAEELFLNGKKSNIFHHYFKPIYRFLHHYIIQLGFLDGKEGYIISKMYAEYVANRYKYLDELWAKK